MIQYRVYADIFSKAYPKAIDFLESEYVANKAQADEAAKVMRYRFAGFRLGRAVFTAKEAKEPSAPEARNPSAG